MSPLRYPGGKRKLIPLVADILLRRISKVKLFVEPFAGGAATSIAMLKSGLADEIAISDRDDLVASFWKIVFSKDARDLADLISNTTVSLTEWKYWKNESPIDDIKRAFKCIYLNRTSFSGILHKQAGPIGGMTQASKYKIDCRFNRQALANRILELSNFKDQVRFVRCQNYVKTLADIKRTKIAKNEPEKIFWYLDPPFFKKADKLYRYSFNKKSHELLKNKIMNNFFPGNWILSYDDVCEARNMYNQHDGFCRVNLSYNARVDSKERLISSEIIVSNIIAELRLLGNSEIPPRGKIISISGLSSIPVSETKTCEQIAAIAS